VVHYRRWLEISAQPIITASTIVNPIRKRRIVGVVVSHFSEIEGVAEVGAADVFFIVRQ
jgi:hypothetical protein